MSEQHPDERLYSKPPAVVAALAGQGERALALIAALGWVGVVEQLTRTLLAGYGLSGGLQVGAVPVALLVGWTLLWLGADRLHDPTRAMGLGAGGAAALLALGGAGWLTVVLAPMVAAGWVTARHLLARLVPPGSTSLRVRLFLTLVLLGIFALLYLQWLALLTALAGRGAFRP